MVCGVVLPSEVLIVVICVIYLVVEGVAEAVLVEVCVWVVLAGRLLEGGCCDEVCCWVDDVCGVEDVIGVEDCGCVADADGGLELLMIATRDDE
jgi:hypothetical protein